IVAAPKGGGSEIFGTFYRMLYPSDGIPGVLQFVMESVRDGCYAGKICPPAIIGVGLGGTADLCMHLAKRAAVLRPIGARNADPAVAELEEQLLLASRELGLGPMGARGRHAVLAFNMETAVTHTAALPVAVNAQCLVGRRWRARVNNSGNIEYTGTCV
ncbi:MAG: fumarate hydratase, partial [Kiritimatiellia bacterium]